MPYSLSHWACGSFAPNKSQSGVPVTPTHWACEQGHIRDTVMNKNVGTILRSCSLFNFQVCTRPGRFVHVVYYLPVPLLLRPASYHHLTVLHPDPHHRTRVTAGSTATCVTTDQDDKCTHPHCEGERVKHHRCY